MKDMKLKHFLGIAFLILFGTFSIVIGMKLYQGISSQVIAEGFRMTAITLYIFSLLVAGGVIVGGSFFLALQWSSKTKDQNNELFSIITEVIKRQEQSLPSTPAQNFTLNLKSSEHKTLMQTSEEEEEEKGKEKLLHNNKNGIY